MSHSTTLSETYHLSLSDFLFLLFQKSRGNTSYVLLGTQQQGPQVSHELTSILPIQEPCQVDLHHLTIRVLQQTHEWGEGKIAIEIMENINYRQGPTNGTSYLLSMSKLSLRHFSYPYQNHVQL